MKMEEILEKVGYKLIIDENLLEAGNTSNNNKIVKLKYKNDIETFYHEFCHCIYTYEKIDSKYSLLEEFVCDLYAMNMCIKYHGYNIDDCNSYYLKTQKLNNKIFNLAKKKGEKIFNQYKELNIINQ